MEAFLRRVFDGGKNMQKNETKCCVFHWGWLQNRVPMLNWARLI